MTVKEWEEKILKCKDEALKHYLKGNNDLGNYWLDKVFFYKRQLAYLKQNQ